MTVPCRDDAPGGPELLEKPQPGKRLFDLLLAVPALIVLAPVTLVVAVVVRFGLGTPVLFRQVRPGLKGRPMTVLKFRTMTDARDATGKLKSDADRLHPIGSLLRKTSLDELPQLWNVVRGDMSLVGPRPLLMEYLPNYSPEQQRRHSVMPGVTGWSQINGRNVVAFSERLRLDVWYVDHWSLLLDAKILALTFLTVFRTSGVRLGQPLEEIDDVGLHPETRQKAAAQKAGLRILTTAQADEWREVLQRAGRHDVYHLPQYHEIAEHLGEGAARLIVLQRGGHTAAFPLLLRPLAAAEGLAGLGDGWVDATSTYGYPGPVASDGAAADPAFAEEFRRVLADTLRELRVVTAFSRLHPFFPQPALLAGLGECQLGGATVSIDLTRGSDEHLAKYRSDHRRDLAALRKMDLRCLHDTERRHYDRFIELYLGTMRRVGAADEYLFPRAYFDALGAKLGDELQLFVCEHEGQVISAAIAFACGGFVQGHLSGQDPDYRRLASNKLIIDEIRLWAKQAGYRDFHLGGGVGAKSDSLFAFKAGFSDRHHEFFTWRHVVEPQMAAQLEEQKERWNDAHGLTTAKGSFFPRYRAAALPAGDSARVS